MNERIKELWNEAAKINAKLVAVPNSWETEETFMNTFAELIVKECADLAKHHVMNISTYTDAEFIEKQIAENFGVKE